MRLEWSPRATDAYVASLTLIAENDRLTAELVRERVDRALAAILEFPGLGTPVLKRGMRSFAVPNTGHVLQYRVIGDVVRIRLWYRARQNIRR